MLKKSNLTSLERTDRLKRIIPGEQCSTSVFEPPETSIYFTQISEKDIEEFHKYSTDARLYEFFEFESFKSMDDTWAYYRKMVERINVAKTHYHWFVRSKENNMLIGLATLASIDFQRNSVEWGLGIDPNYWGQNYNLEIHELLKHFIFDVLDLNRLFGQTMVTNERAIAGIKASGCTFEGISRQYYKKENEYIDAWTYSLLAQEYFNNAPKLKQQILNVKIEDVVDLINNSLETDEISEETTMANCRLWDSLSHEKIIIALTSKYKVKVTPSDYSQLSSVILIHKYLIRE